MLVDLKIYGLLKHRVRVINYASLERNNDTTLLNFRKYYFQFALKYLFSLPSPVNRLNIHITFITHRRRC